MPKPQSRRSGDARPRKEARTDDCRLPGAGEAGDPEAAWRRGALTRYVKRPDEGGRPSGGASTGRHAARRRSAHSRLPPEEGANGRPCLLHSVSASF